MAFTNRQFQSLAITIRSRQKMLQKSSNRTRRRFDYQADLKDRKQLFGSLQNPIHNKMNLYNIKQLNQSCQGTSRTKFKIKKNHRNTSKMIQIIQDQLKRGHLLKSFNKELLPSYYASAPFLPESYDFMQQTKSWKQQFKQRVKGNRAELSKNKMQLQAILMQRLLRRQQHLKIKQY